MLEKCSAENEERWKGKGEWESSIDAGSSAACRYMTGLAALAIKVDVQKNLAVWLQYCYWSFI